MNIFEYNNNIKKKPYLTDIKILQDIIEHTQKTIINEPTLLDKIYIKYKNNMYDIIENNFNLILTIIIIIILLIY